ncbi:hypothetical protein OIK40_12390 [Erythrobacter sp. sf7]|uniref:Uncharacterized protein n=1 Tax=Erythrobacter fulvus TaxID=2987523 RepID=A0ABT5JTF1_9SPHN|nr:hypothetical protein [Erythrobacter fulvus]MDC8755440.1 hypothetical protein [Erythrobacter fulvus]
MPTVAGGEAVLTAAKPNYRLLGMIGGKSSGGRIRIEEKPNGDLDCLIGELPMPQGVARMIGGSSKRSKQAWVPDL